MIAVAAHGYRLGEVHAFEGGGRRFIYLVQSAGIFELDDLTARVIDQLNEREMPHDALLAAVTGLGISGEDAAELFAELAACQAIEATDAPANLGVQNPPPNFPIQTLVLNLTNQCNLSCEYCYEYGADKVATPEGKPKFMDLQTAKASVDFLLSQSPEARVLQITFFGGETLMNFPLLKQVVTYANAQMAARSGSIHYSLTTNATLLTPQVIDFLCENRIGVTVSMDGPKEMHDKLRVFANGKGSYDVVAPKVRELIQRHRTRPVTARVTLTSGVSDVLKIFRHLKHDLGFHEVGFAPVTSSPDRLYAINQGGMDGMMAQFHELADEYLEHALRGEMHGFSNVSETLTELHQGLNKSHPCGAGLGLLGVGPSGDISPCHRFTDSDEHALGHVSTGIDRAKQADFLKRGSIHSKYDCHTCWARPLCAGGCHHEAFVRYGDTGHPNLHYCDWIRGWTDKCLRIYGAIAAQRPDFLGHFSERKHL